MGTILRSKVDKIIALGERGEWLATIFLDNVTGEISIQSEYGEYHHHWSMHGRGTDTLTGFLVNAGIDYLMDKFSYGSDRWLDFDATYSLIAADVLGFDFTNEFPSSDDKLGQLIESKCRMEISELERTEDAKEFQWLFTTQCETIFVEIYEGDFTRIPCVTGYHPRLRAFMTKVWPIFIRGIENDSELNDGGPRYAKPEEIK